MLKGLHIAAVAVLLLAACAAQAGGPSPSLAALANGDHRSAENKARNQYRHPVATLQWFGVEPDMTVVEVWPSDGWYTEILAPYVNDAGKFYGAGFAVSEPDTAQWKKRVTKEYKAKLAARPELYGNASVTELGLQDAWTPAPPGSADRVLTFRNVHNWLAGGFAPQMFAAFYKTLKPGGVLGVVEHRADPGTDLETMKKTGYVTEAKIRQLAADAGFEFVAATDINANPKDDHHHPEGVWTLPPTLRLGDKNRARYLAIGESDRMTLKFRKPVD